MNMMERGPNRPANLEYLDGDFRVVAQGTYVICAVSGVQIPLEDLRYWNVDLQEAYASAEIAVKRYQQNRKG
ncbi:MAG: DUF2093 domain-containing protein [Alphaproteobacteria bacterium]|nr:DUF2093 domain-containing protein [Alphaproteobacteria bacterium]